MKKLYNINRLMKTRREVVIGGIIIGISFLVGI
jgi:hypothetical protein